MTKPHGLHVFPVCLVSSYTRLVCHIKRHSLHHFFWLREVIHLPLTVGLDASWALARLLCSVVGNQTLFKVVALQVCNIVWVFLIFFQDSLLLFVVA